MHLSFSYASKETRLLPSPISDYRLRFAIISPSIATESNKQLEQNQVYYYSVEKIRFFQSKYSFHDLYTYIYIAHDRTTFLPSNDQISYVILSTFLIFRTRNWIESRQVFYSSPSSSIPRGGGRGQKFSGIQISTRPAWKSLENRNLRITREYSLEYHPLLGQFK